MKDIVLIGAGGLGREAAYMIERINREEKKYNLLGFVVEDQYYKPDTEVNGYPVLGSIQWLMDHSKDIVCHCAIGEPKPRRRIQELLEKNNCIFETLVDPSVEIHPTVKIGEGSYIQAECGISVNITIGKGVLLNGAVGLGHDVTIGDYSCIMTRTVLSGHVIVGENVFMGGMAYIVPKITIENDAVVAAGSVVFRKVKKGTHVLGNPAKRVEL